MVTATDELELSEAAEKVMSVIESLSAQDQRRIAHRLLAALDEPAEDPAEVKAAWKAVLQRRVDEIRTGKVVGIPAEEVDRMMREKYP
jgi:putative addiction module component (TIGR02574 family)